ncbi:MAG: hypothetical protein Q9222_002226 [Ikaeria aurantiellina]
MRKQFAIYKRVNALFLTLLESVPDPGTPANPIDVEVESFIPKRSKIKRIKEKEANMKWDDTADKNLLFSIIADQDIRINYAETAKKFGCSASAIQQRVWKLKQDAKKYGFAGPSSDGIGSSSNKPQTGKPRGRRPKAQTSDASGGKEGDAGGEDQAGATTNGNATGAPSDDDEEEANPTKETVKKGRGRKPKSDDSVQGPPSKKQKGSHGPAANGIEAMNGMNAFSAIKAEDRSSFPEAAAEGSEIQVRQSPDANGAKKRQISAVDGNETDDHKEPGAAEDEEQHEVVVKQEENHTRLAEIEGS